MCIQNNPAHSPEMKPGMEMSSFIPTETDDVSIAWIFQCYKVLKATEAALNAVNEAIDRMNPILNYCDLAYARDARDALKSALPFMQRLKKLESGF